MNAKANIKPEMRTNPEEDLLSLGLGLNPRSPQHRTVTTPDYPELFIYHTPQPDLMAEITRHLGHHATTTEPPVPEMPPMPVVQPVRQARGRKRALPQDVARRAGKSETIPAPYPWATDRRATVHDLETLEARDIKVIKGVVQCKKCDETFEIEFDLREKFYEVANFILSRNSEMRDRAPDVWMNPVLPDCRKCKNHNCAKPVIADKKKSINWLFLLLGQMLGCCTLEQLKYFCKHTKNHRTGAKDRVLYLAYLALCKQLQPKGPFSYR